MFVRLLTCRLVCVCAVVRVVASFERFLTHSHVKTMKSKPELVLATPLCSSTETRRKDIYQDRAVRTVITE